MYVCVQARLRRCTDVITGSNKSRMWPIMSGFCPGADLISQRHEGDTMPRALDTETGKGRGVDSGHSMCTDGEKVNSDILKCIFTCTVPGYSCVLLADIWYFMCKLRRLNVSQWKRFCEVYNNMVITIKIPRHGELMTYHHDAQLDPDVAVETWNCHQM